MSVVSRGCRRCSSYSYCKGEAEDADCDCLPGYRKMKDNMCLGEAHLRLSQSKKVLKPQRLLFSLGDLKAEMPGSD